MVKRGVHFVSDLRLIDEVSISFKPFNLGFEFLFLCAVLPGAVGRMKSTAVSVVAVDTFIVYKVANPPQCTTRFGDNGVSLCRPMQAGQCLIAWFNLAAHLTTVA